jgi:hypothetical protein
VIEAQFLRHGFAIVHRKTLTFGRDDAAQVIQQRMRKGVKFRS